MSVAPAERASVTFAGRLRLTLLAGAAIAATALTVSAQRGAPAARATTIVGADLADGTGAALRRANVRMVGDRIVAVGKVTPQGGDHVVAGGGLVVAPGFIDIHNHSASELTSEPSAATQVAQG